MDRRSDLSYSYKKNHIICQNAINTLHFQKEKYLFFQNKEIASLKNT